MKKTGYLSVFAIMALASCSQDDVADVYNGRPIEFRSEVESRGVLVTTANISEMYVTAFNADGSKKLIDKVRFAFSDGAFKSGEDYYWPKNEEENVTFHAFSHDFWNNSSYGASSGTLNLSSTAQSITNFKCGDTSLMEEDLCWGKVTTNKKTASAGVPITMQHLLSSVEIRVKKSATDKRSITIYDCWIHNIYTQGDVTLTSGTPVWSNLKVVETGTISGKGVMLSDDQTVVTSTAKSIHKENNTFVIIPQTTTAWDGKSATTTGTYIKLWVRIEDEDGTVLLPTLPESGTDVDMKAVMESSMVAVPLAFNIQRGKKYVYTLDFSNGYGVVPPDLTNYDGKPGDPVLGNPISISCTVSDWGAPTSSDVKM